MQKEFNQEPRKTPYEIAREVDLEISGIEFEFSSDENRDYFLGLKEKYKGAVPDEEGFRYYGFVAVEYAERWGRLLQARIQSGADIKDKSVVEKAAHDADKWGISVFINSWAVDALVQVWKKGDIISGLYLPKKTEERIARPTACASLTRH